MLRTCIKFALHAIDPVSAASMPEEGPCEPQEGPAVAPSPWLVALALGGLLAALAALVVSATINAWS